MNFLDFLILVPVAWFGYKGLKNGLISEFFSILALIIGTWASFTFANLIAPWFGDGQITKFIAFVVLFIAVLILVHLIGKIIEKVITLVIPKVINHIFGFLFGIFKVVCVFSVLFYMINSVDKKERIFKENIKKESLFYQYIEPIAVPFFNRQEVKNEK